MGPIIPQFLISDPWNNDQFEYITTQNGQNQFRGSWLIPEETMDVKITIAIVLNTIKYTESATEPLFARNNEEATVDKV